MRKYLSILLILVMALSMTIKAAPATPAMAATTYYVDPASTTWGIEAVDSPGNVGAHTSIALDSSNYPQISYRDDANTNLKYAKWTGSSWSIATVQADGFCRPGQLDSPG